MVRIFQHVCVCNVKQTNRVPTHIPLENAVVDDLQKIKVATYHFEAILDTRINLIQHKVTNQEPPQTIDTCIRVS